MAILKYSLNFTPFQTKKLKTIVTVEDFFFYNPIIMDSTEGHVLLYLDGDHAQIIPSNELS